MPRLNRGAVGAIAGYVEDQRKRREEAYKSDREFQQRLQAAGIASGRLEPIIQGGRITGVQLPSTAPFNPASLAPGQTYSQRVGGGTLTSRGPAGSDPYVQLGRELNIQNALQNIEQQNAIAPLLAEAERVTAGVPRPWWQGGGMKLPPAATLPPSVDVSAYRNRLTALQGQGARLGATAPTTMSGIPTSGVDDVEVNDLLSGIQQGLIRTREDAEQVIESAGLDPNDPAFQDILNQLP